MYTHHRLSHHITSDITHSSCEIGQHAHVENPRGISQDPCQARPRFSIHQTHQQVHISHDFQYINHAHTRVKKCGRNECQRQCHTSFLIPWVLHAVDDSFPCGRQREPMYVPKPLSVIFGGAGRGLLGGGIEPCSNSYSSAEQ